MALSVDQKAMVKMVNRAALLKLKLEPIDQDYQKKTHKIKEEIKEIEDTLLGDFSDYDFEQLKTSKAKVTVSKNTVSNIEDWDKFISYLFKYKRKVMDILPRKVLTKACRARWDAGKNIPGIAPFTVRRITITPSK